MTKKLTRLTPEQTAAMETHADAWIARGLDCTPADRARVEDGMRRCYEFAGLPWHDNVVWVDSPMVVALAGPIAAAILEGTAASGKNVAVGVAVDGAVGVAVDVAVGVAVDGAVGDAVGVAVGVAVGGAVDGAVDDAVRVAVGVAVGDAVGVAVDGAVGDAVRVAVGVAVGGAVGDAVRVAVGVAVGGAVGVFSRNLSSRWYHYLGGQHWSYWQAWSTFFRDHCELDLRPDVWERSRAHEDAQSAGWWWPHGDFIIVAERPEFIHREQIRARGWGSHVLHCDDGPAIGWRDGWAIWSWHGLRVPQWVVEDPTLERIQAEPNTEVRRCAIESYGWDRYLQHLDVSPVDECADPGNPGHVLRLFDLPDAAQLYGDRVRLLVMDNASLDRDGTRRTYAETVPGHISTAVDASAWQFDVDPDLYRSLARAT